MNNNLLPIAKEGWKFIFYSVLAFVIFSILDLDFLGFFSFLAIIFFLFVYRNPERTIPVLQENSIVSPVDGTVLSIQEIDNDNGYSYKVEIDSSYLNVSVLRVPLTSTVKDVSITRGTKLSRFNNLSKKLNENAEITFEDTNNNKVKIIHILKQSFDEIKIDMFKSQKFLQGNRYGVMQNGVTTIYLPQNFRLNINVGNELEGSQTLIGYFS